jgi:hypothetical protein
MAVCIARTSTRKIKLHQAHGDNYTDSLTNHILSRKMMQYGDLWVKFSYVQKRHLLPSYGLPKSLGRGTISKQGHKASSEL